MSWVAAYGRLFVDGSDLSIDDATEWFSLTGSAMSATVHRSDADYWLVWVVGEINETIRCPGLSDLLALLRVLTPVIQLASS